MINTLPDSDGVVVITCKMLRCRYQIKTDKRFQFLKRHEYKSCKILVVFYKLKIERLGQDE